MDERPLSYPLAVAWSLVAALLLVLLMQLTVAFRPAAGTDIVNLGAVEALAFTLCTFALLRIHAARRPARAALGLRPTHPLLSVLGIAQGAALQVPAGSLRDLVERHVPTSEALLRSRAALLSVDSIGQLVAVLMVTACVAPFVEELFARGAVYGALCRSHPMPHAAAMAAICFVLLHAEWRNWPSLLVVAATLAHLRAASGSLLPCLASHVAFNAATVLALFTGVSSVTRPLEFSWPVTIAGWLVTAGLVCLVQRVARRSPEAAAARAEDVR
jgi:membrane protease YdiL (CAAX protease family)